MNKYALSVYQASKHGRLEYRRDWTFTIVPLSVVKIEVFDAEGALITKKQKKLTREEKDIFLNNLKEYLFRKDVTPVQQQSEMSSVWHIHPEFDEETKKEIKRLYLFEEL